jgi:hypothetical protein
MRYNRCGRRGGTHFSVPIVVGNSRWQIRGLTDFLVGR